MNQPTQGIMRWPWVDILLCHSTAEVPEMVIDIGQAMMNELLIGGSDGVHTVTEPLSHSPVDGTSSLVELDQRKL